MRKTITIKIEKSQILLFRVYQQVSSVLNVRSINLKNVKMNNKGTTYVSYCRVSTQKQGYSGLGLAGQREMIRNYLKGQEPIAEFIEVESGKKSDRPKLTEALELCRKTGSKLIVAKLDRLSRSVSFTSKLLESGIDIIFTDMPEANRLVLHIIASISEYELTLVKQRTKAALKQKKKVMKLGKPENLLNNLEENVAKSNETNRKKAMDNPNNKRATALLKVLVNQGLSLSEMARRLNEEGFVTSRGKKFTAWQVSVLIKRYNLK